MVRPIELQDALAKTPAAERITHAQRTAAENDQRQALASAAHRTQAAQHKPTPTDEGDEVILHREPDQRDQKEKREPRNQDGEPSGTPNPSAVDETTSAGRDDAGLDRATPRHLDLTA